MRDRESIEAEIQVLRQAEGFFSSAVLFGLLRLGVLDALKEGPVSPGQLARTLGLDAGRLGRLLNAAVLLRILEGDAGTLRLTAPFAEALGGDQDDLQAWLRFLHEAARGMLEISDAVESGRPAWDVFERLYSDPAGARDFSLAMHHYASLRGGELPDFLDAGDARTLLDVGSGPGTYSFLLAHRFPQLKVTLLDTPPVLEVARELARKEGLADRVRCLPLDVLREPIPGRYSLVLVSNTLHLLGPEASLELLADLYPVVEPGGSIVVQAQFLEDGRRHPRWPVLLDLILLCGSRRGANHSFEETERWLAEAGFTDLERCSMSLTNTNSFIRGRRPV